MSLLETTRLALAAWPEPLAVDGDRVAVRTPVMLPSNTLVTVFVIGGGNSFRVSDGRAALMEADAIGAVQDGEKVVARVARTFGLSTTESGEIYAPMVDRSKLAAIISLVANAARQAAVELLRFVRPRIRRDLRRELRPILNALFPLAQVRPQGKLTGVSNKTHTFDFLVDLGEGSRLAVDAVVPEHSSISSATISHLDVSRAKIDKLKQAIVYDDRLEWKASDLGLLNLGARPVPMSAAHMLLADLASARP
jgi:hypothetical protein